MGLIVGGWVGGASGKNQYHSALPLELVNLLDLQRGETNLFYHYSQSVVSSAQTRGIINMFQALLLTD